jgi:hypothetical protein
MLMLLFVQLNQCGSSSCDLCGISTSISHIDFYKTIASWPLEVSVLFLVFLNLGNQTIRILITLI